MGPLESAGIEGALEDRAKASLAKVCPRLVEGGGLKDLRSKISLFSPIEPRLPKPLDKKGVF